VLGLLGIASVLVMVVITHPIGRIAGPLWIGLGILGYAIYRRRCGNPVWGSLKRDWPAEQIAVYEESGETGLVEEYQRALRQANRQEY
jgi:APA family basic amino acid/polyamine antiporter